MLRAAKPVVNYAVNVTNTGTVDADEVVLGFLKPPGAGLSGTPLQTLYGFERVHLKVRKKIIFIVRHWHGSMMKTIVFSLQAGETKIVELYPSMDDLTQVNDKGERYVLSGDYTFAFGVRHEAGPGMGYIEHTVAMI